MTCNGAIYKNKCILTGESKDYSTCGCRRIEKMIKGEIIYASF
ncbi:hypothetical protein CLOL250_01919 [Clostridium sp. L2-50]|nr:hypothetical protein CLOL250_01919 [Clostridium sp. L2-50]